MDVRASVIAVVVSLCGCVFDDIEPFEDHEPLAQEFCEVFAGCECGSAARHLAFHASCVEVVTDDIREIEEIGEAWGLQRDDTCVEQFAERAAQSDEACDALGGSASCERPCRLYHGDRGAGQTCSRIARELSDCAQGLVCNGICYEPCGPAPTAASDAGGLLGDGEPCTGHTQCASQHCPAGYCLPRPGPGEPCPAGLCIDGIECVQGVCEGAPPSVCTLVYP